MEMWAQHGLLCLLHVFISSANGTNWIRESTFDNRIPISGHSIISRSRIHCGEICSANCTCASFFFAPSQHYNCQLHKNVLTSTDGLSSVPTSKYYILDEASQSMEISVEPHTTHCQTFQCPPDDTIFRTVILDDGSYFTYKVHKENANQSTAADVCMQQGSFLARVTSVHKMNLLLQLTVCPGYDGIGYYLDGSNANASDFLSAGGWVMSNGEPVPMTNEFWGSGYPNNPDIQHCLRMRAGINYKLDDCECFQEFYFVCEK